MHHAVPILRITMLRFPARTVGPTLFLCLVDCRDCLSLAWDTQANLKAFVRHATAEQIQVTTIGDIMGDTWNLDYSTYREYYTHCIPSFPTTNPRYSILNFSLQWFGADPNSTVLTSLPVPFSRIQAPWDKLQQHIQTRAHLSRCTQCLKPSHASASILSPRCEGQSKVLS